MNTALPDPHYQAEFYASVPAKRLLAWAIDSVLIVGVSMLAVVMTAFVGLFVWPLLYLTIGFIYRSVTLANGSATWGMRFAGIELRDQSGQRLEAQTAVLHSSGYTLSMAIPVLQIASIIMMLTSSRGQGLTDAMLGTAMLNRRNR